MKYFRLLAADEIECRVSTCNDKGVSVLLYKTARTDADLLDETFGPQYWENDYKLIDGVLYGGIGIDYDKTGENKVWKWDAGTESNTEAEKGRASDAFKRAGFKHGIGRELYSAPFIWIPADKCKTLRKNDKGRWECRDNFEVIDIGYDDKERIERLSLALKGSVVYTFGKTAPKRDNAPQEAQTSLEMDDADYGHKVEPIYCEECLKPIKAYTSPSGVYTNAGDVARGSYKATGRCLCADCWMKEAKR